MFRHRSMQNAPRMMYDLIITFLKQTLSNSTIQAAFHRVDLQYRCFFLLILAFKSIFGLPLNRRKKDLPLFTTYSTNFFPLELSIKYSRLKLAALLRFFVGFLLTFSSHSFLARARKKGSVYAKLKGN